MLKKLLFIFSILNLLSFKCLSPEINNMDRIAFSKYPHPIDKNIIHSMKIDGTGLQQLTDENLDCGYPSYSPDGSKIVFVYRVSAVNQIAIINSDGSSFKQLTYGTVPNSDPTFFPDGQKIIFINDDKFFYKMNLDGTNVEQINFDIGSFKNWHPSVSSDGSKIIFLSNRSGTTLVYIMNSNGTNLRRLTDSIYKEETPSFSPDGFRIVYSTGPDVNRQQIFTINIDGTNKKQLTDNLDNNVQASFSPDGSKILFQRGAKWNDLTKEIYIMNSDGSNQTRLTNNGILDQYPCFSGKPR